MSDQEQTSAPIETTSTPIAAKEPQMTSEQLETEIKRRFRAMSKNQLVRACTQLFFELEYAKYSLKHIDKEGAVSEKVDISTEPV